MFRLLQHELGIVVMLAPARGGRSQDNPGRLVVRREDLLAWLATKASEEHPLKCDLPKPEMIEMIT